MHDLEGYTLADIVGLADEQNPHRPITYSECAEILKERITELHPERVTDLSYQVIHDFSADDKDYCHKLVRAERLMRG
ncbi:MAG: hypothetical protein AABX37_06015 [Nanoarchaeota archaeon]